MSTALHLRRTDAGFTLVESLIAVALLGVLFLAVAQTSSRASDAFDEGSAEHALSTTAHRCIERVARALEFADDASLAAVPEVGVGAVGTNTVTFLTPVSFDGGVAQWQSMEILTELEGEELDDGLDNDGDGLVDERRVVLREAVGTPEERRVVLASGVSELFAGELANNADDNGNGLNDETGLSFSADGEVVFVRVSCQRRDEGGRLLTKTAETAVRPYN